MLYSIDGIPSFRINLYKTSVAEKWKALIKESYIGDGKDIDSRRSFYHLNNKKQIRQDLISAIDNINSFFKFPFIDIEKPIDWSNQDLYNKLHVYFEKLSGNFDNPTRLFKIASPELKESIRDLNYCIHTLEHDNLSNSKTLKIHWTKSRTSTHRKKLEMHEYEYFKFDKKKFEVYLAYNELGKDYVDLWKDKLPIDYKNLKNNHYVGCDIKISLADEKNIFSSEFVKWMNNNNLNAYNKKLGIGLCPIGTCEIISIDHLTKDSKLDIILEEENK